MTNRLTPAAVSALLAIALLAGCNRGSTSSSGGSSGEVKQPGTNATEPPAQAAHEAAANAPAAQHQADPNAGKSPGTHVGRNTNEILNAKEMTKDPNWTVVASDPQEVKGFSVAGTAYNRAAALAGTADLEKWVQLQKAGSVDDKFPTYQELQTYVAQNPPRMPALREYQHYGYDETTGNVVILENKQEKEARRKELGLSPDE